MFSCQANHLLARLLLAECEMWGWTTCAGQGVDGPGFRV